MLYDPLVCKDRRIFCISFKMCGQMRHYVVKCYYNTYQEYKEPLIKSFHCTFGAVPTLSVTDFPASETMASPLISASLIIKNVPCGTI